MNLMSYPVALVFSGGADRLLRPTALVDAVASSPAAAQAVARAMGQAIAPPGTQLDPARVRVGQPTGAWEGSYLYAVGPWRQIPALFVPSSLNAFGAATLASTLRGCVGAGARDAVLDASLLAYLDAEACGMLAEVLTRIRLHLFRPGEAMRKIIGLVGFDRHASVHAGLNEALAAVVQRRRA